MIQKIKAVLRKPDKLSPALLLLILTAFYISFMNRTIENYATLDDILKKGELTLITSSSRENVSTDHTGRFGGFEYDLAKAYAEHLGVKLKVKKVDFKNQVISELLSGKGSFGGAGLTKPIQKKKKKVSYSVGYLPVKKILIGHRSNGSYPSIKKIGEENIYVISGSPEHNFLLKLKKNEGYKFNVSTIEGVTTEKLIQKVANNKIKYTIANSNIAKKARRYSPQIVIGSISEVKENLVWAVNPKSVKLLYSINSFFKDIKGSGKYAKIVYANYPDIEDYNYFNILRFHRRLESRLDNYAPLIKKAAKRLNFDWKLIVALTYQESQLNRWAKSSAKAYGLMQLVKNTARYHGVVNVYNPYQNINAGVKHLSDMFHLKDISHIQKNDMDRLYIALAAYNAGQGHISDARILAKRLNLNPDSWSSLSKTLVMLENKKFYKKSRYGYCRGSEPVNYVKQIMIYYDILKNKDILDS
ncbi:MAG: membrane-bound lytic murein transglycosylase MltF [Desulfobacterales bacterium]|nr:membrane-bound lytic murein transglycosylase MltF [Desulfobacterales bacterium]